MSTTDTDLITKTEEKKEETTLNPTLIKWEEWSLSAEEHMHAIEKFKANPKGRPMGHR